MTDVAQRDVFAIDTESQNVLFREARTANKFADEPVTDAELEAIYDLLQWAPTSANTQPLRLLIVRSDEAKARLLPHIYEMNRPKVESAPAEPEPPNSVPPESAPAASAWNFLFARRTRPPPD